MDIQQLNFHHLRYFWAVAKDGHLTRTAARLHVSQSALSAQIRELEDQLGEVLFLRQGRKLQLSEAGQIVLAYAEDIFAHATELVATLGSGRRKEHVLRLGSVSTLSRNFQESFVRPLLDVPQVRLQLVSGRFDELLALLHAHTLDLVLANRAPRRQPGQTWHCRRIARQMVSLVGRKRRRSFRFPEDLDGARLIVPGPESEIRVEFDALCERAGVAPLVVDPGIGDGGDRTLRPGGGQQRIGDQVAQAAFGQAAAGQREGGGGLAQHLCPHRRDRCGKPR